ncbi:MAG: protein kinase [Longispora sp.]|nr:protein kinase [Longispora sp. (in: high G+C Gram-positive bacteria)]
MGCLLADRYRLEEHINDDPCGRQIWRGTDVILRRPVAMVLRQPGGDEALEMLSAAVTASRVVHPNLAGVYDAVDEGERAYVVREWVDGQSLGQLLSESPLEPRRAVLITLAIAEACAALHATEVAHGNVHPGTVLIGDEGRIVLADAKATAATSQEQDVRALGAVLYAALTGHWPHEIPGPRHLPSALRIEGGKLASPRQVRGGVPSELDALCVRLLDLGQAPPTALELAAQLGRFKPAALDSLLGQDEEPAASGLVKPKRTRSRRRARWILGITGGVVVVLTATLVATNMPNTSQNADPVTPSTEASQAAAANAPRPLKLTASQIRVVDSPGGDRSELAGIEKILDSRLDTEWQSQWYLGNPVFGGFKPGVGILINLGNKYNVSSVEMHINRPGATVDLRTGPEGFGSSATGDAKVASTFESVQGPIENAGTRALFTGKDDCQYLLLWISKLPPIGDGKYQIGVQEITVRVQ